MKHFYFKHTSTGTIYRCRKGNKPERFVYGTWTWSSATLVTGKDVLNTPERMATSSKFKVLSEADAMLELI